jgi:hypothetical protein
MMAYRPNPLGPPRRDLTDYPSVRFAVRSWAIYQVISAIMIGGIILAILVSALVTGVKQVVGPPPGPPPPKRLILRENWRSVPSAREDGPATVWHKMTPPPVGFAYTEDYKRQVKMPDGLKPSPKGYTYTEDLELVPLPERKLITKENWQPAPIDPGDDPETRLFKRRPPPDGYAYDEYWRLVKLPGNR